MGSPRSSWTAIVLLPLLFTLPTRAAAAPALAESFPPGALAYLELRDPATALDRLLASPTARRLRRHAAAEAFWVSPRGLQLALGEAILQGATGKSFRALLRTLASDEVAFGLFPAPDAEGPEARRVLVALRADSAAVERVLVSAERFFQRERRELAPARGTRSALWTYAGDTSAFLFHDGPVWIFASDRALAAAAHAGPAPNDVFEHVSDEPDALRRLYVLGAAQWRVELALALYQLRLRFGESGRLGGIPGLGADVFHAQARVVKHVALGIFHALHEVGRRR